MVTAASRVQVHLAVTMREFRPAMAVLKDRLSALGDIKWLVLSATLSDTVFGEVVRTLGLRTDLSRTLRPPGFRSPLLLNVLPARGSVSALGNQIVSLILGSFDRGDVGLVYAP